MEILETPKSFREGAEPSSCQEMVCWVPAVQEVEATGDVVKTVAETEDARARRKAAFVYMSGLRGR